MARTKGALGNKTLLNMGQDIKPVIKKESTGKRGRPTKVKSFDTVILPVVERKVKTFVPEIYSVDIPKVEKLNQLQGKFCYLESGNNYQDAITKAQKVLSELGYQIINYFEQKTFNRSVIVSYNKS